MSPSSPWGKKKPQEPHKATSGFPGLKPSTPISPAPNLKYEEIQDDELVALAAIYGEDFHQVEKNQVAWKVLRKETIDAYLRNQADRIRNQNPRLKYVSNPQMRTLL